MELAYGLYSLCPEQDESQFVEGIKRSLLPVSKSTVYNTGSDIDFEGDNKVIPVKVLGGVPIEMVPYHKSA